MHRFFLMSSGIMPLVAQTWRIMEIVITYRERPALNRHFSVTRSTCLGTFHAQWSWCEENPLKTAVLYTLIDSRSNHCHIPRCGDVLIPFRSNVFSLLIWHHVNRLSKEVWYPALSVTSVNIYIPDCPDFCDTLLVVCIDMHHSSNESVTTGTLPHRSSKSMSKGIAGSNLARSQLLHLSGVVRKWQVVKKAIQTQLKQKIKCYLNVTSKD